MKKINETGEKTLKSETIYDGRILSLRVETVELPNMKYAKREIVDHPRGAAIVALSDDGRLYFVRQYRAAVHTHLLEIPAGIVEPNEDPKVTAERELQEEIGFKPGRLEYLMDAYVSPGFTNEKISLFLAQDLVASELPKDETEFLEVELLSIEEAYQKVINLEIVDAKTIIGIQYAYQHLSEGTHE